jgi:hypothetical protein
MVKEKRGRGNRTNYGTDPLPKSIPIAPTFKADSAPPTLVLNVSVILTPFVSLEPKLELTASQDGVVIEFEGARRCRRHDQRLLSVAFERRRPGSTTASPVCRARAIAESW